MTTFRSLIFNKISCLKISFLFSAAVVAILLSGILASCNQAASKERSQLVWSRDLPVIGSQSSPRTADLNKDGVLDIVIGAGKNEFQKSDMGILA
ncbi:MAG: FG-GAP repeat protein, partial [Flavisolibacter sp.]|nr:FG-GAP repeat protein [Flavisolibacter sp.]